MGDSDGSYQSCVPEKETSSLQQGMIIFIFVLATVAYAPNADSRNPGYPDPDAKYPGPDPRYPQPGGPNTKGPGDPTSNGPHPKSATNANTGTTGAVTGSTVTPDPDCKDVLLDCQAKFYPVICNRPEYNDLMLKYCAKTCSMCHLTKCMDKSPYCGHWKNNGFCQSVVFSKQTQKEYCAKTCNLCNT